MPRLFTSCAGRPSLDFAGILADNGSSLPKLELRDQPPGSTGLTPPATEDESSPMPRPLTKSRYLDGLQCGKLMWTKLNAREKVPAGEPWHARLAVTARQLDDLAKQLWEGGVEVPPFRETAERVTATRKMLPKRVPLFGATFQVAGRLCRTDVLEPAPDGRWDLVEIKAGTRIRNNAVQDLAFQRDCLLHAGLELDRIWVMHPDTGYVRGEHLHVHELFRRVDVTERVLRVGPYVDKTVENLRGIARGADPDTPIGPHCHDPHSCRMIPVCWAGLPEHNVTELNRSGRGVFAFMDEGIFRIRDIPDNRLGPNQLIQKRAVVSGRVQVDGDAVRRWLDKLRWPLWFLDFETMAPAVPPFAGLRPYQQIPFQYSLHVQDEPGGPLRHHEFLHMDAGDPRPCLLKALLETVGDAGSLVAWNMDGEKPGPGRPGRLQPAARRAPARHGRTAGGPGRTLAHLRRAPSRPARQHHPEGGPAHGDGPRTTPIWWWTRASPPPMPTRPCWSAWPSRRSGRPSSAACAATASATPWPWRPCWPGCGPPSADRP